MNRFKKSFSGRFPERRNKQEDDRVHFQTSYQHKDAKKKFQPGREECKITGRPHQTETGSCGVQKCRNSGKCGHQVDLLEGKNKGAREQGEQIEEEINENRKNSFFRNNMILYFYGNNGSGVEFFPQPLYKDAEQNDYPDDFQPAAGGGRTSTDHRKYEKDAFAESRPCIKVCAEIPGGGNKSGYMDKRIVERFRNGIKNIMCEKIDGY